MSLKIDKRHRDMGITGDHLDRLAVLLPECRPQNFVPADNLIQRLLECTGIQWSADAKARRHVVDGAACGDLIEKPEPPLARGKRSAIRTGGAARNAIGFSPDARLLKQRR